MILEILNLIWGSLLLCFYLFVGAGANVAFIAVFRKFLMRPMGLESGVLPYVSVISGAILGVSIAVGAGASVEEARMAVLAGPASGYFWDALLRYFFKK
jgi:hypothetical protein